MRGSLVFVEFLFLAATASFFSPDERLRAQSVAAEQDLLLGSWQLDLVKSRYTPGPPPRSEVRTYVRDNEGIKGTIRRRREDGREEVIVYRADFDREYPVMGTDNYDHVTLKRIDEYTSEAVLSHAGRVYGTARRVIASDNKSMTITFRRQNETGPSVYNVVYYDRIALKPGEPQ